jgi:Xaa-Pro dipeptidase
MKSVSRRALVGWSAAGAAMAAAGGASPAPSPAARLKSLTAAAQPIGAPEHQARLEKLQSLLQQRKTAALLVEAGSSLEYFTGIRWWRSERTTAALIPAQGQVVVVTPFFEEPSIRETLKVAGDVRPWKEDASPFELLAEALRAQAGATGSLAVEPTTRYFIVDRVTRAAGGKRDVLAADELVRACRIIKSPAELALMQIANDVTLAAIRHVHGAVQAGMLGSDLMDLMIAATTQLGGAHEFALVLLNEASAYPHGSVRHLPQLGVRAGLGPPAGGVGHREARPGGGPRERQAGRAGGRNRPRRARVLRAKGLEPRLRPAGPVAPHRTRDRTRRPRAAVPGTQRPHAAASGYVLLR